MYAWRPAVTATLAVVVGAAGQAYGQVEVQEPPASPPVQVGPVILAPVLSLSNFGHDSNVFNRSEGDEIEDDLTAVFTPSLGAWIRGTHFRLAASTRFGFYYFRDLTELRAVDSDVQVRVDVPLNRVTPYVEARLVNTRHEVQFEIDSINERQTQTYTVGADVQLSERTSVGVHAGRLRLDYEEDEVFRGTDLARALNFDGESEGITARYAVTGLTTVGVTVERSRDRFDFSTERDSNSWTVRPHVEFAPLAVINGYASIGYQRRKVLSGSTPDFTGTVAEVSISHRVLDSTELTWQASRRLEYSYIIGRTDYVLGMLAVHLTHRILDAWDVGGGVQRYRVSYRAAGTSDLDDDETTFNYDVSAGYTMTRTRVGFNFGHATRDADVTAGFRAYSRTRFGTSVTYTF